MAAERPIVPTPESVLQSGVLSREEKIKLLRQMLFDAEELSVASGEGMEGPTMDLARIHDALRELGVTDTTSDSRPAHDPSTDR